MSLTVRGAGIVRQCAAFIAMDTRIAQARNHWAVFLEALGQTNQGRRAVHNNNTHQNLDAVTAPRTTSDIHSRDVGRATISTPTAG